ncbi:PREDICTED: uncharacterized protein LOC101305783 [Fragaria vesca subsp. vesca]
MDSDYTAKLVYSGEGEAILFNHNVSYFDFANSVRDRFHVLGRSIVKLRSISREANCVADKLADLGHARMSSEVWLSYLPVFQSSIWINWVDTVFNANGRPRRRENRNLWPRPGLHDPTLLHLPLLRRRLNLWPRQPPRPYSLRRRFLLLLHPHRHRHLLLLLLLLPLLLLPSGQVDQILLRRLAQSQSPSSHLLGWFSGRRRSHLRPSLREFAVSNSLTSNPSLSFPIQTSPPPIAGDLKPCLFLLFASPITDQTIHTHEYRAYQFRTATRSFEPKSIDIVNIGPAFRGHYGAFSPSSQFPALPCELRAEPMNVDRGEESLGQLKTQSELDMWAEGLEVSSLSRLMGLEAASYTSGVEELYGKMLVKIESLAREVEDSSAKIREQEDHNRKLRYKAARTAGL